MVYSICVQTVVATEISGSLNTVLECPKVQPFREMPALTDKGLPFKQNRYAIWGVLLDSQLLLKEHGGSQNQTAFAQFLMACQLQP